MRKLVSIFSNDSAVCRPD